MPCSPNSYKHPNTHVYLYCESTQSFALTTSDLTSVTAAFETANFPVSFTLDSAFPPFISLIHYSTRRRPTEDDFVPLLPHLGHQRFTRDHAPNESNFDVRVRAKRLEDVFARDAHEAEPVQD